MTSSGTVLERANGGNDLVIANSQTGSTLTISGYFSNENFKNVVFADGIALSFIWIATSNNYVLTGSSSGSNVFDIMAGAGSGTINFADNASVGGTNTIEFVSGSGSASVNLNGGTGAIAFDSSVSAQNVYLQADNNGDLTVKILGNSTDSITINGDLTASSGSVTSAISQIQFSDGSAINLNQGGPLAFTWLGSSNNYFLTGSSLGSNVFDISSASGPISGTVNFANNSAIGGSNTVQFVKGSGSAGVNLNGGTGTIAFDSSVSAQNVYLQADNNGDLTVKILGDATDSITVSGDLAANSGSVTSAISQLQFSGGSAINLNPGEPLAFTWFGNSNNYFLTGSSLGSNVFDISAGAGSGTINFANNSAIGGTNTINFVSGSGSASVNLNGGTGAIAFDSSVSEQNVYLQADSNGDLIVKILGDSTDSITVSGDLAANSGSVTSAISQLQFSGGSVINLNPGEPLAFTWFGSSNNYFLTGSSLGSNVFDISAGAGSGTINFANAASVGGTNTINFVSGSGSASVNLNGGTGAIAFDSSVSEQNVYLQSDSSGDLIVKILGDSTDSITVSGDLKNSSGTVTSAISQLQFSGGSVINLGQGTPPTFTWFGSSNNYCLTGSSLGSNVFDISAGAGSGTINFANAASVGGTNTINFVSGSGSASVNLNGGTGAIAFDSSVSEQNVYLQSDSSGDLIVKILGDSTDSIIVSGDLKNSSGTVTSAISQLQFSGGSVINLGQGTPPTFTWFGSSNNYSLTGSSLGSNVFDISSANGSISGTINFANNSVIGGTNTVEFVKGSGSASVNLNGGTGAIAFDSSVSAQNVYLQADSKGDLTVKILGDSTDTITVNGDLTTNSWGVSSAISQLKFSDGSVVNVGQPSAGQGALPIFTWLGSGNNYSLTGSSFGSNVFDITAGAGNGTVNFVNDSAIGGTNTIEFVSGSGSASVNLNGGTGAIAFDSSVSAQNVYLQADSNGDLIVKILGDSTDGITVKGDLTANSGIITSAISQLQFSGGSVINLNQGTPPTFSWFGSSNNYSLTGSSLGSNVFDISSGSPISGTVNFANNSAIGGTNTVEFVKGSGSVSVNLNGGTGAIAFDSSVSAQNVYLQADSKGDLTVKILGDSTDSITVNGDLTTNSWGVSSAISQLKFSDGSVVNVGQPSAGQGALPIFTWLGSSNNYSLTGSSFGSNVFDIAAGAGNGTVNFVNNSAVGGTNTVEFVKGSGLCQRQFERWDRCHCLRQQRVGAERLPAVGQQWRSDREDPWGQHRRYHCKGRPHGQFRHSNQRHRPASVQRRLSDQPEPGHTTDLQLVRDIQLIDHWQRLWC